MANTADQSFAFTHNRYDRRRLVHWQECLALLTGWYGQRRRPGLSGEDTPYPRDTATDGYLYEVSTQDVYTAMKNRGKGCSADLRQDCAKDPALRLKFAIGPQVEWMPSVRVHHIDIQSWREAAQAFQNTPCLGDAMHSGTISARSSWRPSLFPGTAAGTLSAFISRVGSKPMQTEYHRQCDKKKADKQHVFPLHIDGSGSVKWYRISDQTVYVHETSGYLLLGSKKKTAEYTLSSACRKEKCKKKSSCPQCVSLQDLWCTASNDPTQGEGAAYDLFHTASKGGFDLGPKGEPCRTSPESQQQALLRLEEMQPAGGATLEVALKKNKWEPKTPKTDVEDVTVPINRMFAAALEAQMNSVVDGAARRNERTGRCNLQNIGKFRTMAEYDDCMKREELQPLAFLDDRNGQNFFYRNHYLNDLQHGMAGKVAPTFAMFARKAKGLDTLGRPAIRGLRLTYGMRQSPDPVLCPLMNCTDDPDPSTAGDPLHNPDGWGPGAKRRCLTPVIRPSDRTRCPWYRLTHSPNHGIDINDRLVYIWTRKRVALEFCDVPEFLGGWKVDTGTVANDGSLAHIYCNQGEELWGDEDEIFDQFPMSL